MKSLKIPFFASADDIVKLAKKKYGKHKKFTFARWPDDSLHLIILNGTVNDPEDFKEENHESRR